MKTQFLAINDTKGGTTMKKLICLCLGLTVVFALMSGCKGGLVIGPTEPTTVEVNPDDLNNAMNQLGDLDAAAQDALRKLLEQGVTIPAEEPPPETMPPPMPQGVEVDAAEARALLKKVFTILNSGKLTMKMRGSSPFFAGANNATPLTVAVDEGVMAFEMEMDWASMFKSDGQSAAMARIQGASAQSMFGKRLRMITKTDGMAIVFPDRDKYLAIGDGSEEGGEPIEFDLSAALGEMFGGTQNAQDIDERLKDIKSSRVTSGGKDYLCAEVTSTNEDGSVSNVRYFFDEKGDLRRIEAQAGGESMMWEIETLSGQVDPAFFSTAGMSVMGVDQLTEMGGLSDIIL